MTEVIAIYKFEKTKEEDLSFDKDDRLTVIAKTTDPNWVVARNRNGDMGLVPVNFFESEEEPSWLHGDICREEAERILHGRKPGSFLVRMSSIFTGDFTLCLVTDQHASPSQTPLTDGADPRDSSLVQHYHIHTITRKNGHLDAQFFSLDEITEFPSLRTLIRFYMEFDKGLSYRLIYPVRNIQRDRLLTLKSAHWIQRELLSLGQKLDHGEFCEVIKGTFMNEDVAIKRYNASEKKLLIYEAWIMTSLKHTNIVALIGVTEEIDGTFYLVMEYLATGSLLCYLRSRGRFLITPAHLLSFAIGVADALVYMETLGFLHCDIAARNILLSDANPIPIAKLGDFGLARYPINRNVNSDQSRKGVTDYDVDYSSSVSHEGCPTSLAKMSRIPIKWTAPECIRSRVFSHKSDVWSFGILLWELYSFGRLPYPQLMTNQVLKYIESGERMAAPDDCPAEIYFLMRKTWHIDPNLRPSFFKILENLKSLQSLPTHSPVNALNLGCSLADEGNLVISPRDKKKATTLDHVYESDFTSDICTMLSD